MTEPLLPPLADRIRPRALKDFVGQPAITGQDSLLRRAMDTRALFSFILWGPPGTGKTTLARIVAGETGSDFQELSAVASGVRELRKAIERGRGLFQMGRVSLLFIDEIHRFHKGQQDALLHAVEEGTIILAGATTENPSFEVIAPLLSRCRVIRLFPLTDAALDAILNRALATDVVLLRRQIALSQEARSLLVRSCGGDARKMLNALEGAAAFLDPHAPEQAVTPQLIARALEETTRLYDKSGDAHYDTISAFIKSVRGSDPDAAVYWLAVMLDGGEKPEFIARRLVVLASEDVGNADPQALPFATGGFHAVHQIGMPEASIVLAQVTTYLAAAPKSNASYRAILDALQHVRKEGSKPVPFHLRNAPTPLMKAFGFGEAYDYPHDAPGHFIATNYFPDAVEPERFYQPSDEGYEKFIRERLGKWWPEREKRRMPSGG